MIQMKPQASPPTPASVPAFGARYETAVIRARNHRADPGMRTTRACMLAGAAALAAAAPATAAATTRVVTIKDIDFAPATVRIKAGDSVEWRFMDERTPHNVVSRGPRRFRSSATKSQGTYRVRFRRGGTYRYVCTIHLNMAGKVVVR